MKTISNVLAIVVVAAAAVAIGQVRGRAVDERGAAIAGAQVEASGDGQTWPGVTDEQGRFGIAASCRVCRVRVTAKGFLAREMDASAGQETIIELRPAGIAERVSVTAARGREELERAPESQVIFSRDDLRSSAAANLDDQLRQIPGFGLFRRTSSRVANPTSQGASMRGVGASGASRVLVLRDGIPLNDPFGGWVYWSKVPMAGLGSVETVRGGASHVYGSDAMGGVVGLVSPVARTAADADLSWGSNHTPLGSAQGTLATEHLYGLVAAEGYRSNGYFVLAPAQRGTIDRPAALRYGTGEWRLGGTLAGGQRFFGGILLYNEKRSNGTALQGNGTRSADFDAGVDWPAGGHNLFRIRGFGTVQRYTQTFSSIAANRNAETLTRAQTAPSQQAGSSAQWQRPREHGDLTAGFDARQVRGLTDEIAYVGGVPRNRIQAGGRTLTLAPFARAGWELGPRVHLVAGGRIDVWQRSDGFTQSNPLANPAAVTRSEFADQRRVAPNPYAGLVVRLGKGWSATASGYTAFRAPTLNELYRSFRVGNVLTNENPKLEAEQLYGGETGLRYAGRKLRLGGTYFVNRVDNTIANRTLSVTPALITRQRQNLGSTQAQGAELDGEWQVTSTFSGRASYAFIAAQVHSFSAQPTLVGNALPQTPRHSASFAVLYRPARWTFAVQGRGSGRQFDDDQNLLPLDPYFQLDLLAARRVHPNVEVYTALENLTGERAQTGRTPFITLGTPFAGRVGLRVFLPRR